MNVCPICSRQIPDGYCEKHHLTPKMYKGDETIIVCNCCGDMLHQLFTNKELKNELNTLESIVADPKVQKWANWISKKPNSFSVCVKKKKRK